jgi:hypothetical protein
LDPIESGFAGNRLPVISGFQHQGLHNEIADHVVIDKTVDVHCRKPDFPLAVPKYRMNDG